MKNRRRVMFWMVFLISLVVRGGVVWHWEDRLREDPDAYRAIAQTLAITGTFGVVPDGAATVPTAFRPPLYPWLLSWWVGDDGQLTSRSVAVLHTLLGAVTVALTYCVASRWVVDVGSLRGPRWIPWVAAALTLVDPILCWQSTVVMTETLATMLAVLTWWWWVARMPPIGESCEMKTASVPLAWSRVSPLFDAAIFGGLLALSYLCRPTFLVWAVLMGPLVAWSGPVCRVRRAARVLTFGLVIAATVGAWTLRNASELGSPVWATTHGGYTLHLANNDSFFQFVRERPLIAWQRDAWDATAFFNMADDLKGATEVENDRRRQAMAMAKIERDLPTFWRSCLVRVIDLWHPVPHPVAGRPRAMVHLVGVFYSVLYGLILVALWRHRGRCFSQPWWPLWTLVLSLTAVHAIYFSNPRMRAPAVPLVATLAATALLPKKGAGDLFLGGEKGVGGLFSIVETRFSDSAVGLRRVWAVECPKARIVMVHGIISHGGWYTRSAERLAEHGFEVHFLDRRGSGLNSAERGDVRDASVWGSDVIELLESLPSDVPRKLLGISWGGKLAVEVAKARPDLIDAMALICPGIYAAQFPSSWKYAVLGGVNRIGLGGVRLPIPLRDPAFFTDDPNWQRFIATDPMTLRHVTVRFALADRELTRQARTEPERITVPTWMVLAGRDRICDNAKLGGFFDRIPSPKKHLTIYPEATHTFEFEPDPETYLRDLVDWAEISTSSEPR